MKNLFFAILYTLLIISLGGCKTVSKKIEDTTEKEKQKLSKWLNKPEEDLKSLYGQPDKIEFLKTFLSDSNINQKAFLDKILKSNPKISKSKIINQKNEDLSIKSIKQKKFITENMALIYVKQKKFKEAIKIYEKLISLNSKKKSYFAKKIENLKKLKK